MLTRLKSILTISRFRILSGRKASRKSVRSERLPHSGNANADSNNKSPEGEEPVKSTANTNRISSLLAKLPWRRAGKSASIRPEPLPEYRFFRWRGDTYLVGFEWSSKKPGFFSRYPMHLSWRDSHIVSPRKLKYDYHILMPMVAGQIGIQPDTPEWAGATRILLRDENEEREAPLYWSAVFHEGRPVYDRELLTRDPDYIRSFIQQECTNRAIEQLIADEKFLASIMPGSVSVSPIEQFDKKWKLPEEEPQYLNTRYQPVIIRTGMVLATVMVLLAGSFLYLLSGSGRDVLISLGLAELPEQPEMTYPHVIDWQEFTVTCRHLQEQSWPISPGWTLETIGCSARGMQDAHHQPFYARPDTGSAYRSYRIKGEHHEWLTLQAAKFTTRNWEGNIEISPEAMVLSRPMEVKLLPWKERDFDVTEFADHTNRQFLGTATAIEEDADRMVIRTSVRDRNVFPILHEMKDYTPFGVYTLNRTKGELTLTLGSPNVMHLTKPVY